MSSVISQDWVFSHVFSSPILLPGGEACPRLNVANEAKILFEIIKEQGRRIHFRSVPATSTELMFKTYRSRIVHFSGHGSKNDGVGFEYPFQEDTDNLGKMFMVTNTYIEKVKLSAMKPDLVFIAACYSEKVSVAFLKIGVKHVIAISSEEKIGDKVCERFARLFYSSLLHNNATVLQAFKTAVENIGEESDKFVLLPKNIDTEAFSAYHDVHIELPDIEEGGAIDGTPSLPIGILDKDTHAGREKLLTRIYRTLHMHRDPAAALILTGEKGMGKYQIALRALRHSFDRREFKGYFVINGTSYSNIDPEQLPLKVLRELLDLQKQSYGPSDNTVDKLLSKFKEGYFAILLHKFNHHVATAEFGELISKLVNSYCPAECKVIITYADKKIASSTFPRSDVIEVSGIGYQDAVLLFRRFALEGEMLTDSMFKESRGNPSKIIEMANATKFPLPLLLPIPKEEEKKHAKYQYCVVVAPAPTLFSGNVLKDISAHDKGCSFSKLSLVDELQSEIIAQKLSAVICSAPKENNSFQESLSESDYLVFCGIGVGLTIFNNRGELAGYDSPKCLLAPYDTLPKVVIICLTYGAEKFANFLSQRADNVHVILWIDASVNDVMFEMGLLMKRVSSAECDVDLFSIMDEVFEENVNKGFEVGLAVGTSLLGNILRSDISQKAEVFARAEETQRPNNILCKSCLSWDNTHLSLATPDVQLFRSILDEIEKQNKKTKIMVIGADSLREDRNRSVAFEVVKNYISSSNFRAILAVDTEWKRLKLLECARKKDFSEFLGCTDEEKLSDRNVLIWLDMHEACCETSFGMIKEIMTNKAYKVLLTFSCHIDHQSFMEKFGSNIDRSVFKLSETNEAFNHIATCSSHCDEIIFHVKTFDETMLDSYLGQIPLALQELVVELQLGKGIQVIAVYERDDKSVVVRVSISDVKSLQIFFNKMLIEDGIDAQLSSKLSSKLHKQVECRLDPSMFIDMFERAMLHLENPTERQLDAIEQCQRQFNNFETCGRVHLQGPAGSGKTFIAIHLMYKNFISNNPRPVVFITKNESLSMQVVKLLKRRGIRDDFLRKYFYTKNIELDEANQILSLKTGFKTLSINRDWDEEISLEISENIWERKDINMDQSIVIVDEAHHLFEVGEEAVEEENWLLSWFQDFLPSRWLAKCRSSLLHTLIEVCFPSYHQLLLMSDLSQSPHSSLEKINSTFGISVPVKLGEVVRSSEHIMDGGDYYAIGERSQVKSHHNMPGLAIKSFIFDAAYISGTDTVEETTLWFFNSALAYLMKQFEGVSFAQRLAILVPNQDRYDAYRDRVTYIMHQKGIEVLTAKESVSRHDRDKQHAIIFDTIDNFDGLESLIVIGLDFDRQSDVNNEGRSACHRVITRAQMLFILAGAAYKGGYFEWLKHLKFDPTSSKSQNNNEEVVDKAAASKLFVVKSQSTKSVVGSSPTESESTSFVEVEDGRAAAEPVQSPRLINQRRRNKKSNTSKLTPEEKSFKRLERKHTLNHAEAFCHKSKGWDNTESMMKTTGETPFLMPLQVFNKQLIDAEQGDVDAQYRVGVAYAFGEYGFEKDLEKAKEWYTKAAEQEHIDAKFKLKMFSIISDKDRGKSRLSSYLDKEKYLSRESLLMNKHKFEKLFRVVKDVAFCSVVDYLNRRPVEELFPKNKMPNRVVDAYTMIYEVCAPASLSYCFPEVCYKLYGFLIEQYLTNFILISISEKMVEPPNSLSAFSLVNQFVHSWNSNQCLTHSFLADIFVYLGNNLYVLPLPTLRRVSINSFKSIVCEPAVQEAVETQMIELIEQNGLEHFNLIRACCAILEEMKCDVTTKLESKLLDAMCVYIINSLSQSNAMGSSEEIGELDALLSEQTRCLSLPFEVSEENDKVIVFAGGGVASHRVYVTVQGQCRIAPTPKITTEELKQKVEQAMKKL